MTADYGTPLSLCADDELDLQVGKGLAGAIVEPGVRAIRDLRSRLARDGKHLPLVRLRDNSTLAPFSFLLHHDGRLTADADFATIGDILQALSRMSVPTPPLSPVGRFEVVGRFIVIN